MGEERFMCRVLSRADSLVEKLQVLEKQEKRLERASMHTGEGGNLEWGRGKKRFRAIEAN